MPSEGAPAAPCIAAPVCILSNCRHARHVAFSRFAVDQRSVIAFGYSVRDTRARTATACFRSCSSHAISIAELPASRQPHTGYYTVPFLRGGGHECSLDMQKFGSDLASEGSSRVVRLASLVFHHEAQNLRTALLHFAMQCKQNLSVQNH